MNRYFVGKRKKLSIKQGTTDLGFIGYENGHDTYDARQ
jgi:hypothetical protein